MKPEVEAAPNSLLLEPIGYVRSAFDTKVEAARQPGAALGAGGATGRIELLPGRNFEHALEDLAGWEFIWVIFWFHLNPGWRPKVLPPRSTSGRKGVFATRSPHRPNPLGLSSVRLERVEGLTLHILDVDMVDGSPVLDIKPYVPYSDARALARSGWLDATGREPPGAVASDPVAGFDVQFDALAAAQADWIERRTGFEVHARIRSTLALGPAPHPYRRIRREGDALRLAVKEWRARFQVAGRRVRVIEIRSGYRPAERAAGRGTEPIEAHCEFVARWPESV